MVRAGKHKKKHPYRNINFAKKKTAREATVNEEAERLRLIDEFIRTKGVTRCPSACSLWDKPV